MTVVCPYCNKTSSPLWTDNKTPLESGEGIPCKCNKCKHEFMVFINIVQEPETTNNTYWEGLKTI